MCDYLKIIRKIKLNKQNFVNFLLFKENINFG